MRACVMVFAGILLAAGCGSSPKSSASGTLQALAQGPGHTVALIPGDADFAPGPVRFTFLVIANDGRPVLKPTATVAIAHGLKQAPFEQATARLEPIGVPGVSAPLQGVPSLYVVRLNVPAAGTYWVLAKPAGATVWGLGSLRVRAHSYSPAIGAKAVDSNTPTLATTGGRLAPLTTAEHPDRALYTTSVAQALAAHEPFVVAFATPKFCTSRTCGPVVDVVSHVRRDFANVRFIHVEVFAGNDPARGYNRWMREWGLPSEPWVFVVGSDGRIKAKFEGSVSVSELRAAVQTVAG
ncbi:MAG: hypothetical protein ACYDA3_07730 [Gaiellaceae bacterium]